MSSKTIDLRKGGNALTTLYVEGAMDQLIIEAFLDAGARKKENSLPVDWRTKINLESKGGVAKVLEALDNSVPSTHWGLIDRDWKSDDEIQELRSKYPRLLILPRVMIESYLIDPAELQVICGSDDELSEIDFSSHRLPIQDWVANGAVWQVLYERGADDFCNGHGFPEILRNQIVLSETEIENKFKVWHDEFNPVDVVARYQYWRGVFGSSSDQHFARHMHGKNFFHRVITPLLNKGSSTDKAENWKKRLARAISKTDTCPPDLVPVLQRLFEPA